jgi:CDP-diacylglycerol--serine O-phosphatidyltransferase
VKYFLVGFAFIGAAVLNYAWITLIGLCLGYVGLVLASILAGKTSLRRG